MPLLARALLMISGFLAVAGAIYWVTGREYLGGVLILAAAGAAGYIGIYLRRAVRAADHRPTGPPVEVPHVGPTIWPLVLALAPAGVVAGLLAAHWLLVAGLAVFALAAVGWLLDIRHQHRTHGPH
jgi:cytochrome c oxidase subunit IV